MPEQEDLINRQREDVEVQIDRELDEFDQTKERWRQEDDRTSTTHPSRSHNDSVQTTDGHIRSTDEENRTSSAPRHISEPQEQGAAHFATDADSERHRKDSIDDTGDIVVEADEDTVIY